MGVTLAAVADDGDLLALDQIDVGVAIVINAHDFPHPSLGQALAFSSVRPRERGDPGAPDCAPWIPASAGMSGSHSRQAGRCLCRAASRFNGGARQARRLTSPPAR